MSAAAAASAVLDFAETLTAHCRQKELPLAAIPTIDVLKLAVHTRLAESALTMIESLKRETDAPGWLTLSLGDLVALARDWQAIDRVPETRQARRVSP